MGVAIAIALTPTGVDPPGVNIGVECPGVPWGVVGVIAPGVIAGVGVADGVSSHRDLRFEAPGVGVSYRKMNAIIESLNSWKSRFNLY